MSTTRQFHGDWWWKWIWNRLNMHKKLIDAWYIKQPIENETRLFFASSFATWWCKYQYFVIQIFAMSVHAYMLHLFWSLDRCFVVSIIKLTPNNISVHNEQQISFQMIRIRHCCSECLLRRLSILSEYLKFLVMFKV